MSKDRIISLQKRLSIAQKALKQIRDNSRDGRAWVIAEEALDEIEHITVMQEVCP